MDKINYGYVPANMPGGPTMCGLKYNEKEIAWWNDNSIIKYSKLLVSAYHLLRATQNNPNIKNELNIDSNIFLIMDSGGFSMSTLGEIDIKPQQVIDLSIEYNADIMMSLDIPPYNLLDETKDFILDDDDFNEKMETSYNNAKYMEQNRQNYNGKYYVCIHGDNLNRLDLWWNKMSDIKCEGYALAPKNKSDYWILAQTLLWIYHKGVKENIHFLAFSGINTIPVLIYFSKYINNLTFDSSSWAGGAMRREYCINGIRHKIIYGDSTNYNISIPCKCELCSQINNMAEFNNKTYGGALMSLHNLIMYENFCHALFSLKNDEILFKEFVKININEKIIEVFNYIDFGIKNGLELANQKYNQYFNNNEIRKNNQTNIFNF